MKTRKRLLATLLCLCMAAMLLPATALADGPIEIDVSTLTGNRTEAGWSYDSTEKKLTLNSGNTFTISGGTFNDYVYNEGTISGGTTDCYVVNKNGGTISGGTFNGGVYNDGTISGGTFNGPVLNDGNVSGSTISGGTFYGLVLNDERLAMINGGMFYGEVKNRSLATITGGTFYGNINNSTGFIVSYNHGIIYELNNGSWKIGGVPEDKTGYPYGISAPFALPAASDLTAPVGKVFGGWYEQADYSGSPVTQIEAGASGVKTFYVKWVDCPGHTGGTATCTAQAVCERCAAPYGNFAAHDWNAWQSISETQHNRVCNYDNTHTETAAHVFGDWRVTTPATATASGSRERVCADCGHVQTEVIPATGGDTTDYYTLTFNTGGGSAISSITRAENTTIDLTLDQYIPTREGWKFTGWYSDAALKNKIVSIRLTRNTTIYAGWDVVEAPVILPPKTGDNSNIGLLPP